MNLLAQTTVQPAAPLFLGLPVLAWAGIAGVVLVLLFLYRAYSQSADAQANRAAKAAKAAQLKRHAELTNAVLRHPEPVEPAPLDYIRDGQPIPKPVSNAVLAAKVRQLEAGQAGGAAPLAPTPTAAATSTAGTTASVASAPNAPPPGAGVSNTAPPSQADVLKLLQGK